MKLDFRWLDVVPRQEKLLLATNNQMLVVVQTLYLGMRTHNVVECSGTETEKETDGWLINLSDGCSVAWSSPHTTP